MQPCSRSSQNHDSHRASSTGERHWKSAYAFRIRWPLPDDLRFPPSFPSPGAATEDSHPRLQSQRRGPGATQGCHCNPASIHAAEQHSPFGYPNRMRGAPPVGCTLTVVYGGHTYILWYSTEYRFDLYRRSQDNRFSRSAFQSNCKNDKHGHQNSGHLALRRANRLVYPG